VADASASRGFRGSLAAGGGLDADARAERRAGCLVLLRGHVANRRELLGLLRPDGTDPPDDAGLIALAYRRFGERLAAHVDGEYAAVVVDPAAGAAVLAHDPLGLVPLFYARVGDRLEFATHLADLVLSAGPGELDHEYLADYVALSGLSSARTPYRAMSRLAPGESLRWLAGRAVRRRVWDLADVEPLRLPGDWEYDERFRELLAEAVGTRIEPGATWCELSGGLDSSTVASVAARSGAPGLAALSVVYDGAGDQDERSWMRDVVEMHGLPWHPIDWGETLPFSELPDEFLGEPTGMAVNPGLLRRRDELVAENGVTVLLSGQGGDELMPSRGDQPLIADLLYERGPIEAARQLARWRRESSNRRSHLYWAVRGVATPAFDHLRGRRIRPAVIYPRPPWLSPEWVRAMDLDRRVLERRAPSCRTPGRQELWDTLWTTCLIGANSRQRRGGPDVRFPLLHRPLVEFMAAIPWEQRLRPRCDRLLQRRALKGVIPESVRHRGGKSGSTPAIVDGLSAGREWYELLTDSPRLAELGIVDRDRWRDAVGQARLGQTHGDMHFLTAVHLEAWLWQLDGLRRPAASAIAA
jgi:asparagine synthase (glutamine-hydrolysing)